MIDGLFDDAKKTYLQEAKELATKIETSYPGKNAIAGIIEKTSDFLEKCYAYLRTNENQLYKKVETVENDLKQYKEYDNPHLGCQYIQDKDSDYFVTKDNLFEKADFFISERMKVTFFILKASGISLAGLLIAGLAFQVNTYSFQRNMDKKLDLFILKATTNEENQAYRITKLENDSRK